MLTVVDTRLVSEARRYALCFACERCAHYDPELVRCGNGYPAEPLHQSVLDSAAAVAFCKEFELG